MSIIMIPLYVCLFLLVVAFGLLVLSAYRQLEQRGKKGMVLSDVTGRAHWIGESEVIKLPVYVGTIDHWMYKPFKRLAYLIPDPDAPEPCPNSNNKALWLAGDCWRVVEIRIKEGKHTIGGTIYGLQQAQVYLMEDTWTTF